MRVYEGIESGAECERLSPIVEALALGRATSEQVLEIRPHLRHCSACRAAIRELHLSRLRRASLLWPVWILAGPLARARSGERRADPDVPTLEDVLEIEQPPEVSDGLFASIKHEIALLFHRLSASDAATGLHLATSSGGGRISTLAAIVALCLSSVTAGTVCVVTGVIPNPVDRIGSKPPPYVRQEADTRQASDRPERQRPHARRAEDAPALESIGSTIRQEPPDDRSRTDSRRPRRRPAPQRDTRPQTQSDPAQAAFGIEDVSSAGVTASAASQGSATTGSAPADTSPSGPPDAVQETLDPAEKEFAP